MFNIQQQMKSIVMVVLGVCTLVGFLTGCPAISIDPVTDLPIVTDDEQVEMGNVIVEGNFNEAKALIDWNDIVAFQKPRINYLEFDFYETSGKAGGGEYFYLDVENGVYSGNFLVPAGQYDVFVYAYDVTGALAFECTTSLEVVAGEEHELQVLLGLPDNYSFEFTVNNLPGEYNEYGYGNLTVNSESYYCSYYRFYPQWESDEYVLVFVTHLPIDFDGRIDQATLVVTDIDGNNQATELSFNIFDVDVLRDGYWYMNIPYVFPEWLGVVEVDIDFEVY